MKPRMGTDMIPTPWTLDKPPGEVLLAIRKLNPCHDVALRG